MSTCIPCMDGNHDSCRYTTDRDCVCRCQHGTEPTSADGDTSSITPIGVLLVVAAVLGLIILAGVL